jgi:hypothetical protein
MRWTALGLRDAQASETLLVRSACRHSYVPDLFARELQGDATVALTGLRHYWITALCILLNIVVAQRMNPDIDNSQPSIGSFLQHIRLGGHVEVNFLLICFLINVRDNLKDKVYF